MNLCSLKGWKHASERVLLEKNVSVVYRLFCVTSSKCTKNLGNKITTNVSTTTLEVSSYGSTREGLEKWLFKADQYHFVICWRKKLSKRHINAQILKVNFYVYQKTGSSNVKFKVARCQLIHLYHVYSPTRYTMWSQWISFNLHLSFSCTCFGPHRSIIRIVLYKLYSQTLVCGTTVRTSRHVQPLRLDVSSSRRITTYQSLQIQLPQNAPDDGPMRSETCTAKT